MFGNLPPIYQIQSVTAVAIFGFYFAIGDVRLSAESDECDIFITNIDS